MTGLVSAVRLLLLLVLVLAVVHLAAVRIRPDLSPVTLLLLQIGSGTSILAVIYYAARTWVSVRRRKSEVPALGTTSGEAGFLIETFQGLIRGLKVREEALERLRRAAEERVEDVESYTDNILRSVSSGVITLDREGHVTTFNLAAEQILGVASEAAVGRKIRDIFGPGSRLAAVAEEVQSEGRPLVRRELQLERDGRPAWVGVSASLLRNRQNIVLGTTLVFSDLTEVHRLQEQVELKKQLAVLGEMSAALAHEFRNYIGTILGLSKLIQKQLAPGSGPHRLVEGLVTEIGSMERLIDELLSFARPADLRREWCDLGRLLQGAGARVGLEALPGIKTVWDISPTLPRLQLDRLLILQSLTNLFQNAVDAMPGGGELRISARVREGVPRATEIEIADTGVGIPPDQIDRIFLPFYTTKEKGNGLGLALVRKVILAHNGRLEVESRPGAGALFRILLPPGEQA